VEDPFSCCLSFFYEVRCGGLQITSIPWKRLQSFVKLTDGVGGLKRAEENRAWLPCPLTAGKMNDTCTSMADHHRRCILDRVAETDNQSSIYSASYHLLCKLRTRSGSLRSRSQGFIWTKYCRLLLPSRPINSVSRMVFSPWLLSEELHPCSVPFNYVLSRAD
jgi:hypothetical protein